MSKRKQANKKQYSGDGEYSDLQDNASMDSEDVTYSDVNKPRPAKSASTNPNNLKLVLKIGQVKSEGGLDQTMDPSAMNPPPYPVAEPPGAKMTENPLKIKIRLSGGGRDAMTGAPLLPHPSTPSKGKRTRPGEHESDDMALDEEHVTPVQPRGRGRPSSRQKRKREEGVGTPQSPASSYQTGVDEDEDSDSDFENRSQSSSHLLDHSGLIGVEGLDTFNMPHSRGRGKKNDKKAGAPGTPATPQGAGPGNTPSTKKKQQPKTRSSTRKKQKKKQPSSPTSGGQEAGYGSYDSDPENADAPHPYYCTPPNFWKNLEPYFQDLTQADIDALMPKNDGIDPDDVYFQLPALGTHYKDVWQEEDEKGIDTSYGRQSSRLTTSRGQFGDMGHEEPLDGFGDNNMLAQSKDHFAEEEPVRCENFTSRILSAMLEEHLTLPGSYGQSPLNKKAMDGRQGNPFNRSGSMPLNRSVSGYGADPFGGEFENGGYGAPNYPNNPLGLAIPLGIAPVEGYSYQSQLLLNEKIKQELMNLGLDLSEPEPPPSSAPVVSAQPTATPVELGEDDEILQELKKLQQQLRDQLTLNAANNKRLAQLAVPKMHEQGEAKKKVEEVAALEQVLLSKITTRRGKKRPGRKTNTSAAAAASASKKNTSTSTSTSTTEPGNNTAPAQ